MFVDGLDLLAMGGLATWRLSHLLVSEDGPGDVLLKVRQRVGAETTIDDEGLLVMGHGLLSCELCTSVYMAALVLLLWQVVWGQWLVALAALSGASCIVSLWEGRREQDGTS